MSRTPLLRYLRAREAQLDRALGVPGLPHVGHRSEGGTVQIRVPQRPQVVDGQRVAVEVEDAIGAVEQVGEQRRVPDRRVKERAARKAGDALVGDRMERDRGSLRLDHRGDPARRAGGEALADEVVGSTASPPALASTEWSIAAV
jgi:hypothetical protein